MQTEYAEKYITLGLKIAYYRKKRGYTQEVFAEKIGKSLNFLAQVEGTGTVRCWRMIEQKSCRGRCWASAPTNAIRTAPEFQSCFKLRG